MAIIHIVRHGRAQAGFEASDPGLDVLGQDQAECAAKELARLSPRPILTSPLRRARETAAALGRTWKCKPIVEQTVAEIPTPARVNFAERVPWLRAFMGGSWRDADPDLLVWRKNVIATLLAVPEDVVIFSHFVAINVGVGASVGDDRVAVFAPDNCSITVFETNGTTLKLIELGRQSTTRIG